MITLVVDESVDKRLEKLAPSYLEGKRMASRRVVWVVELLEQLKANGSWDGNGSPRANKTNTDASASEEAAKR